MPGPWLAAWGQWQISGSPLHDLICNDEVDDDVVDDRKKHNKQARERWKTSEDGGCKKKKEESQRMGKQGVLINHLRLLIDICYVDFKYVMDESHLII